MSGKSSVFFRKSSAFFIGEFSVLLSNLVGVKIEVKFLQEVKLGCRRLEMIAGGSSGGACQKCIVHTGYHGFSISCC